VPETIEDFADVKHARGGLLMDRTVGICNVPSGDSVHRHLHRQGVDIPDGGVRKYRLVSDYR